ncbi:hypothetical protein KA183_00235 [bacterium]|nr:hypothetical protein [bacterium]
MTQEGSAVQRAPIEEVLDKALLVEHSSARDGNEFTIAKKTLKNTE